MYTCIALLIHNSITDSYDTRIILIKHVTLYQNGSLHNRDT